MSAFESEYPLNPLCRAWLEKIKSAEKFKIAHFQEQADEAMTFFECGKALNDLMWDTPGSGKKGVHYSPDDEDLPAPKFRMVVGKVAEIVELFGPSLYHRNPSIVVEPKLLDIPTDLLMTLIPPDQLQQYQMQAQETGQPFDPNQVFPPDPDQGANRVTALLLNYFLDYIQRENDKKTHSRRMIDEALIKGMGILWTESFRSFEGGPELIGSFYDTVDNLLVDPDAETIEESLWIARKCTHPVWQVAEEYGIDQDFLEEKYGTRESANSSAESTGNDDLQMKRKVGKTNDLIDYWKIYSKMGMGHKLKGIKDLDQLEDFLDEMGDNCYIVVADKIPYPLSLRQKDVEELFTEPDEETEATLKEQLFQNCQWPIPFWADGAWPFTHLSFHDVPNNPWPMSHVKPALGYLKFLNWIMSFLANKIRVVCRTVAVAMKSTETEIRERLMSGKDFEVVELPASMMNGGTLDVSKIIQFLQMPEFHGDIWKVVEAVAEYFDKATGLTELMYASHGGVRSAAESNAKQAAQNIRPDDMANKVEDCMSLIARKEALAARWLLQPDAVQPILGTRGTMLWARHVMSGDLNKVSREYNYRIEAGSARKPNKETAQANINMAIQTWMPFIQMEAQKGDVQVPNAFMEQWGKAFDIETKKFLLPQPASPPPNPEMMKVQAEMQKMQQEAQIKQQESGMRQQESQSKLALELRKSEMEIAARQHEMQLDAAAKQQEMQLDAQATGMELQAEKAKVGLDLQASQAMAMQKLQMGRMDMANEARMGEMKLKMQGAEHKQKLALQKKQMAMKPKPSGVAK